MLFKSFFLFLKTKKIKDSLWTRLEKFKSERRKIDEALIIEWFKQILSGLDCLHKNKIVNSKIDM
jgi:serine/threonine protein kinase